MSRRRRRKKVDGNREGGDRRGIGVEGRCDSGLVCVFLERALEIEGVHLFGKTRAPRTHLGVCCRRCTHQPDAFRFRLHSPKKIK